MSVLLSIYKIAFCINYLNKQQCTLSIQFLARLQVLDGLWPESWSPGSAAPGGHREQPPLPLPETQPRSHDRSRSTSPESLLAEASSTPADSVPCILVTPYPGHACSLRTL